MDEGGGVFQPLDLRPSGYLSHESTSDLSRVDREDWGSNLEVEPDDERVEGEEGFRGRGNTERSKFEGQMQGSR